MRVIVYEFYGQPSVLQLKDVEKPAPKEKGPSVNGYRYDKHRGASPDKHIRGMTLIPSCCYPVSTTFHKLGIVKKEKKDD